MNKKNIENRNVKVIYWKINESIAIAFVKQSIDIFYE
jgi:hypothetical protein